MKGNEIRRKFIDFFLEKGHVEVEGSSLVPYDDPTLLFTNAGMVPFKNVFLGLEKRPYQRAVGVQRCLRAGGKHNDLESVGRTPRHHTFFEMLGNFSFGDYFKKDAIAFAWEFVTRVLGIDKEMLYATVFEEDDEAEELWQQVTDIDPGRILRIGEKDNFWAMGETGPCGPCSEIFVDRGEQYCCGEACGIGQCDCDRWMEIWNLVFMQYNRDSEKVLHPLPNPSIDTGMGLERLASVLQGVESNYDTDLLRTLIEGVEKLSGRAYDSGAAGFPFRVIADHARGCSFLVADGVMPSNEGRGYVLRRILRRAVRLGKTIGLEQPFLYKMVPYVRESLAGFYPELDQEAETITKVIKLEEERFFLTLHDGLAVAEEIIANKMAVGAKIIDGEDIFLLYDTYGFPLDLTKDIAEEHGFELDEAGFETAMEGQRQRARAARYEGEEWDQKVALAKHFSAYPPTAFIGYEQMAGESEVLGLLVENEPVREIKAGQKGYLLVKETPCYPEGGGQAGDKGTIFGAGGSLWVEDTQKLANGVILHQVSSRESEGRICVGEIVSINVDEDQRKNTSRNHSATHLLHKALRHHLGEHLHQAGSLVTAKRLRFDFNHFSPLTAEDTLALEAEVNRKIWENLPISAQEMPLKEAKESGAMAFFGDKYGDIVRVVAIDDYSRELCGGTHCRATGEIGLIKIVSEAGIGSGLRRIEALTSQMALNHYQIQESRLQQLAQIMKVAADQTYNRLEALLAESREQGKEIEKLLAQKAKDKIGELIDQAQEIAGIKVLTAQIDVDNIDIKDLRNYLDLLRDRMDNAAIVLAAKSGEKVHLVAAATEKAQAHGLHAGQIIKHIAAIVGGSGGGRPDLAQAGGKDPEKIIEALEQARKLFVEKLEG